MWINFYQFWEYICIFNERKTKNKTILGANIMRI